MKPGFPHAHYAVAKRRNLKLPLAFYDFEVDPAKVLKIIPVADVITYNQDLVKISSDTSSVYAREFANALRISGVRVTPADTWHPVIENGHFEVRHVLFSTTTVDTTSWLRYLFDDVGGPIPATFSDYVDFIYTIPEIELQRFRPDVGTYGVIRHVTSEDSDDLEIVDAHTIRVPSLIYTPSGTFATDVSETYGSGGSRPVVYEYSSNSRRQLTVVSVDKDLITVDESISPSHNLDVLYLEYFDESYLMEGFTKVNYGTGELEYYPLDLNPLSGHFIKDNSGNLIGVDSVAMSGQAIAIMAEPSAVRFTTLTTESQWNTYDHTRSYHVYSNWPRYNMSYNITADLLVDNVTATTGDVTDNSKVASWALGSCTSDLYLEFRIAPSAITIRELTLGAFADGSTYFYPGTIALQVPKFVGGSETWQTVKTVSGPSSPGSMTRADIAILTSSDSPITVQKFRLLFVGSAGLSQIYAFDELSPVIDTEAGTVQIYTPDDITATKPVNLLSYQLISSINMQTEQTGETGGTVTTRFNNARMCDTTASSPYPYDAYRFYMTDSYAYFLPGSAKQPLALITYTAPEQPNLIDVRGLAQDNSANYPWDITPIEGQPYQGACAVEVRIPKEVLTDYGGKFTIEQVRNLVYARLPAGVIPLIRFE